MTDASPAPAEEPEPTPRPARRRRWLRWVALGTSVLVLAAAGVSWALYQRLNGNITTDQDTAEELARHEDERPAPAPSEARNILLLGSDSRDGSNSEYGRGGGTERSDTTMLLHLPKDRSSATAMSLPRDLMVELPSCRKADGSRSEAQLAQFNWAFEFGGAACTIRTVEKLTDIRVDHHMIVDFTGFKDIVNAVGGVEVCLADAVNDTDAKLDLEAGRQVLQGEDALGYVRARKSFDGSDTQRMDRQQQFLGSLVQKVRTNGVLLNPTKLYPFLDAATSALTADSGLNSLKELYDLASSLRNIPEDQVRFLTVPRKQYTLDANRDELVQPAADQLFTQLRKDRPIRVGDQRDDPTDGKKAAEDGSSSPTYRGITAARDACAAESARNGAD